MLELIFKPLQPGTWDDFVTLFGERGACGGCWCMLWRLTRRQFEQQKGQGNKQAMQAIVNSGHVPGILAYHDGPGGRVVRAGPAIKLPGAGAVAHPETGGRPPLLVYRLSLHPTVLP